MGAIALGVDHHVGARAHHALDAEPAAMAAGAAGIRHQRIALHHDRKLDLGLLVRAVVGVAVVDADRAGDAVLGHLGAPAAAERPEAADEELGCPGVDAVERRRQEVGVMAGDHAAGNRRRQRLEDRVDDGHRIGHPPAHRRRPHRADHAARRHDDLEAAERAVVDRIVRRRGEALVGDLRAGVAGGDAGIVEAAHLLRDLGQVDGHLVALDDDAHRIGTCLPRSMPSSSM